MSAIGGAGAARPAQQVEQAEEPAPAGQHGAGLTFEDGGAGAPARSAAAMAGSKGLSIALLASALGALAGGAGGATATQDAPGAGGTSTAAPGAPEGYAALDGARGGQMLHPGASGEAVTALQKALSKAGIEVPATGTFDAATAAAVRKFQAAQGIGVDGVVGPQTMGALDKALGLAKPPAPSAPPAPSGQTPSGPSTPASPATPSTPATPAKPTSPKPATQTASSTGDPKLPAQSPARGTNLPVPSEFGRLKGNPSPAVVAKANELLKRTDLPIGSQVPVTIDGKEYLFAVEWHKHAATDNVPDGLKDWHRGISVYEKK